MTQASQAFDIMLSQSQSQSLSANEALSGIFGSVSLTAWICLLVRPPQKDSLEFTSSL